MRGRIPTVFGECVRYGRLVTTNIQIHNNSVKQVAQSCDISTILGPVCIEHVHNETQAKGA
jgi:hypothetical protein